MSYGQDYSLDARSSGISAASSERAAFIRRTYGHLAVALLALIAIEAIILTLLSDVSKANVAMWFMGSKFRWIMVFVAFMAVGSLANYWAQSGASQSKQYMGLALYVLAEAVILMPMLCLAYLIEKQQKGPGAELTMIPTAGILTLAMFGGLTLIVFITKKDFSFLGSALTVCSVLALGIIVASMIFGFSLGLLFISAMIALMSGYIIYYTSNVLHHYHTSQHVAAALALFAAIATLFWYILQLLIALSGRD